MFWSLSQWALLNFSHGAAAFALNWLLQSTVLILVGLAIARCLARQGSAVQFVVYCTTLTAVLVCPALTWTLSLTGQTQWSLAVPMPNVTEFAIRKEIPPDMIAADDAAIPVMTSPRPMQQVRLPRRPEPAEEFGPVELPLPEPASESEPIITSSTAAAVPPGVAIPLVDDDQTIATPTLSPGSESSSIPWLEIAMGGGCLIWLSLSALQLARLATAWFRLAGIRRRAIPAEATTVQVCQELSRQMGVAPPAVMHTPFLPSPCLAGLLDPAVLLPESELSISLRDVLIHELAHLRRRDGHWNLLRKVATGLFWFQPLLWVLSRRIELSAEEVCDDFVVELGGNRAEYAHRLVDVAEFSAVPMATAGVAMVSFRSMLAQRVERIMDTSRHLSTRTSRRLVTTALLAGSVGTLIIGFLGAVPSTSAEPNSDGPQPSIASTSDSGEISAADSSPETLAAEKPDAKPADSPAVQTRRPLPGLISSPAPLPGNRRWQMYTRNAGSAAEQVSWSPDGRWLAIANGQLVRLFDYLEGTPEFKLVLAGHDDTVKSVRFNAAGDRLATASLDGTVRIWDADGREQLVYRDHEDGVRDVSWHPAGDRIASASLDGTVRIWTIDGKTAAVLREHEAPVNAVAWNPNGKLLASGCENKTIRYWSDAGAAGAIVEGHIGPIRSLAWNFDGSQLLSCDFGIEAVNNGDEDIAHMKIWDTDGNPVNSLLINSPLSHVAWSPDGKRAAAGGWRSIKLWTIGESQAASTFSTSLNGIVPVAWRPAGDQIAAGPMIVDANSGQQTMIPVRNISLNSAGLNADGTVLGIGRANQSFSLFTSDGEHRFQAPTQPGNAYSLMHAFCWSPDGKTFIPGVRYSRTLQRYDVDGAPVGNAIPLSGDTRSVAWSRDGKLVAAGGDQQIVSLVDLETSKVTVLGRQQHGITKVRFTPDQQQVCSAGFDSCIRFWSLDGKPVKVLEAISAPICSLAWDGDGQLMATGHQDNTIRFWSGEGDVLNVVGGHGGHVETLEFNPAGTLLASGSRDQSVRIWKRDGTPVAALQGHSGTVYGIQWTPDGRGIYSCADDGTIRLWNAETGMAEWQALLGQAGGCVTVDALGRVKHGDEKILESDFVFFVEDDQQRLTRTSWTEIRAALPVESSARASNSLRDKPRTAERLPLRTPESPAAVQPRRALAGLISSPAPLPGDRRWQMFTKYPSPSAGSVDWSADGRWLAIASGRIVRIFDMQTGTRVLKSLLVGHDDLVRTVRFSPANDLIATAAVDGTVRIWNRDGREKLVYRDHEDAVHDVAWHPAGDRLASASLDSTVRIWTTGGKTISKLADHDAPVNAVAWNPNGDLLASGCQNKVIRYWTADGKPGAVIEAHIGPVTSLAWNRDGTQLLSCDRGIEASDGQNSDDLAHMKTWDAAGNPLESAAVDKPLTHCCWSPDGVRALAGGSYSSWMWRPADRNPAVRMAGLKVATPVAWRPSGDLIAVGSFLRDENGQPRDVIPLRNVEFGSIGLKPDGTLIGAGRSDRTFHLFTSDGEQIHHSAPLPNGGWIDSMVWSPDGETLIPGQRRSQIIQRYDAGGNKTGNPIQIRNDMRSVGWSRDGRYVVTGGDQMIVTLVDLTTGKSVSIGKQAHYITNVRFTPDQKQICSTGYDGCIRFWTLDGKPVKVLEAVSAPIRGLAWTSDGELMASGHEDHTIRLWNREGDVQNIIGGHGDFVEALDFNPAGILLASSSRDNTIRIWTREGKPVSVLRGHVGAVMAIQWTPDGRQLVSGADDGTIRIWDVETGTAIRQVLLSQSGSYVTVDAQGRVVHGDPKVLESDFVFFAEDSENRLALTDWADIRAAIQSKAATVGQAGR